jgi:hypothetical protein
MKADDLRQKEEQLFARWRARRRPFISDGLIDPDRYLAAEPKIAFALKEVNYPNGKEDWDLRAFLRDGGRPATWNNIVRWTIGIRSAERLVWERYETVTEDQRRDVLPTITVMNVKKSPGAASADSSMLKAVANEDRDLLAEQLDLYRPDLLICCGVQGRWFPQLDGAPWHRTGRGIYYRRFGENQLAIGFYHPQVRWPDNLMFFGLVDAIHELRATVPAEW